MNIIAIRQEKRAMQVMQIQTSIEKAINEGKKVDYDELVMATLVNLNLSRTTAIDYVNRALFKLKLTKEELEKVNGEPDKTEQV